VCTVKVTVRLSQCTKLASQLHTTTANTTRYVLGLLLNYHPLCTDTTCTHLSHQLHTPLAAPNNTYTTYLSSSRCNTCITTPTSNTPDLTDTQTRYQLNTTAYTCTHEIPTMFSAHYSTQRHYGSHILRFCSPLVTVQNTICGNAHTCSPDDGHNDAQNVLR
jgi:hypothetical protein